MNRLLAVALIALALGAGFIGGMIAPREMVGVELLTSSTPTLNDRFRRCYEMPTSEGVNRCVMLEGNIALNRYGFSRLLNRHSSSSR